MRSIRHLCRCLAPFAALLTSMGCAALSNPTTFPSVPVRRLPDEILGKPRDEQMDVPQTLLRQTQPKEHVIDSGDVLGIVFDRILGEVNIAPPVTTPQPGSVSKEIGVGYPFVVYEDGTVSLPLVDPITVKGLTLLEAKDHIQEIYLKKQIFDTKEQMKLSVTLIRPRLYHVLVIRQDSGGSSLNYNYGQYGQFSSKRGSGNVLDLPAYENDVLTALIKSGGLPGNDAKNEVIIQRGVAKETVTVMPSGPIPGVKTTRIPLRLRPGELLNFTSKDIILNDGDIVFIQSRDTEVYYTGGLIPPGEYPIPRDYDLDVLKALAQTHSPLVNGGVAYNNQNGTIVGEGIGAPSPSQVTILRRCPGNRQIPIRVDLNRALQDPRERILIQPGDVIILQETMGESITRYLTGAIHSIGSFNILHTPQAITNISTSFP